MRIMNRPYLVPNLPRGIASARHASIQFIRKQEFVNHKVTISVDGIVF